MPLSDSVSFSASMLQANIQWREEALGHYVKARRVTLDFCAKKTGVQKCSIDWQQKPCLCKDSKKSIIFFKQILQQSQGDKVFCVSKLSRQDALHTNTSWRLCTTCLARSGRAGIALEYWRLVWHLLQFVEIIYVHVRTSCFPRTTSTKHVPAIHRQSQRRKTIMETEVN